MITTLTGTNSFLLQQDLTQRIKKFVYTFGDLNLEKLDGEEASAERLIEAIQSLPFLAEKKLIILRTPSYQKAFIDQFEVAIKGVPETVDVVIVEPKIDKRSSYYKLLKNKTEYKEFTDTDSNKLNTWIVQYVKGQSGSISSSDAQYLIERVGQNQQLLHNELEKLLTYSSQIDRTAIDLLTEQTPHSTIFELIDAAFAGNNQRTLLLYQQQRSLKVEPQQIIAMLAWQLHVLAIIKTAGSKSADDIASEAKLNPYVVRKTMKIAQQVSLNEVKDLVRRALELDVRIKSQAIDADEAILHFLLTIHRNQS